MSGGERAFAGARSESGQRQRQGDLFMPQENQTPGKLVQIEPTPASQSLPVLNIPQLTESEIYRKKALHWVSQDHRFLVHEAFLWRDAALGAGQGAAGQNSVSLGAVQARGVQPMRALLQDRVSLPVFS